MQFLLWKQQTANDAYIHYSVADRFANTDHTYILGETYSLLLIEQSWRYLESGQDSNFLPYSLCLKTPSKAMSLSGGQSNAPMLLIPLDRLAVPRDAIYLQTS